MTADATMETGVKAKDKTGNSVAETIRKEKIRRRKQKIKISASIGCFLIISYMVYLLFVPFQGGKTYGICKTFLELYVRYPHTLRLSTVHDFGASVRIWFSQVDSFGVYRMEAIQCYFKADPEKGIIMEKITLNRREIDENLVQRFNVAIPQLLQSPPDLSLPTKIPDKLKDMQIETNRFRRPIL